MNRSLIVGALGALFAVPAAQAAPVALNFDVASGGAIWDGIDNETASGDFNLSGVTGGSAFAINDASTPNNDDAYDDAFAIAVNGELVPTSGATVDVVAGAAGTTVTADPVVPAGFSAEQQLFFFDGDPLVRMLFEITNTGAAATTATIEWATDLGADSTNTTLEVDRDGSGVLGSNDRFVVFSDNGAGGDPFTLFTFYGGGAGETPSITGLFDGDDVNSLFELFLAPGETKSLLFFGGLFDTVTSSIGEAADFGSSLTGTLNRLGADGFLTGLTDEQLATVVNYAVPTPAPLALLGLGLAGIGMAARRRRTR